MTQRLARYVQPDLSDARLARQWSEIDPRSMPSPVRRLRAGWLAAALCMAAVAGVALRGLLPGRHDAIEGTAIESGTITLSDGSRVALAEGGRMRVQTVREDSVVLALEVGSLDLAVPHSRRILVVRTPHYDVVDVGTRFRVALNAQGDLQAEVVEGAVEIRSREGKGAPRTIAAGESWSNALPVPPVSHPAPAVDPGVGSSASPGQH